MQHVVVVRRLWGLLLILAALAELPVQAADQEPALTTARQVRLLAPDQAAQALPVTLEAIITFIDAGTTVFIQDGTGGTFFNSVPIDPSWQPGQRVRVEGKTYPGLYVPGIRASRVQALGVEALPAPTKVSADDLASGKYHYQWVELEGIGRSVGVSGENSSLLRLAVGSRVVEVRIGELPPAGLQLVDAPVRVRGLAAGGINDRRQLVDPYVRVRSYQDVTASPPPDPADVPLLPASHLLRFHPEGATGHRVRLLGVVLDHRPGEVLFVRDGDQAVQVQSPQMERLHAGERVEILGFPQMGTFRAGLADAEYRRLGADELPAPRTPSSRDLRAGLYDADLVQVSGRLVAASTGLYDEVLTLQTEEVTIRVRCSGRVPSWPAGSELAVTGIYRVTSGSSVGKGFSLRPVAFEVWTRSADDLRLLRSPAWWTAERLLAALLGLAIVTLGALGWVAWLRRRVRMQTQIIHEQLACQTILEERQRIAREVHDSLEQELVGLALRLDAVVAVAAPPLQDTLESTRRLVGRIQAEVRDLVWGLREQAEGPGDLGQALARLTQREVPCRLEVSGEPWPLAGVRVHNLVRIAQEALTNVRKHAAAQNVVIDLAYHSDQLRLQIKDDGRGFSPAEADKVGHFGLVGMRERARKTGAMLRIDSAPGHGTVIEVILPRSAPEEGKRHDQADSRAGGG